MKAKSSCPSCSRQSSATEWGLFLQDLLEVEAGKTWRGELNNDTVYDLPMRNRQAKWSDSNDKEERRRERRKGRERMEGLVAVGREVACARTKWLVLGVGVDFGGITRPHPAEWLASHFVGLASCSAKSGLRVLYMIWASGVFFFVVQDSASFLWVSQGLIPQKTVRKTWRGQAILPDGINLGGAWLALGNIEIPPREQLVCLVPFNSTPRPPPAEWRAQAILPDGIKLGERWLALEKIGIPPSHSAAKWLVSGVSTELDHWDALFHSISTPGLRPAQWRAQAILPDGINLGGGVAYKEFTAAYQFISLSTEYEFRWFECTDGTVYQSEHSILPPEILRTFRRGRKFCEEIDEIDFFPAQVGKVRMPFYLFPDHPDHNNPQLAHIFDAVISPATKILVTFNPAHPVISNFNQHFRGKRTIERRRAAGDWMRTLNLVPTPELAAVLQPSLMILLGHQALAHLHEPECQERVLWVGSALLQTLAVQHELGEPLNLNGDILEDLITGRVILYLSDGPAALETMFGAISWPDVKSGALAGRMEGFKRTHTFYDPNLRLPTLRRDDPSIFVPTAAIPVRLKRKADGNIEEDKKPVKRAKRSKETNKIEGATREVTGKRKAVGNIEAEKKPAKRGRGSKEAKRTEGTDGEVRREVWTKRLRNRAAK
ncbi:hypothetical protein DFH08DRAFT_824982 [Mycena albidolilacea]|uniref:Uncharacterized protein n=1 Tax=Mycena albidolilacea TaxID=1033008 RepID=A0AAD6Z323_9AGAR|nr:hypothetical protein DFH08DRAFT_824982 [Mycena albidolilacea]